MKSIYLVHLFAVLSLFFSNVIRAQESGPASETMEAEEAAPQTTPEEVSPELNQAITRYTEEVQRLERENGAYNSELVEGLTGLGLAYTNVGNHTEALKTYERALHISRINNGLHSLEQVPVIDRIIEANTALNNHEKLIQNHDYLLWVYRRNYGGNYDPAMVPVIERVANWYLHTSDMSELPESRYLIEASNLFRKAFSLLESTDGQGSPRLIGPLYGIFNANVKLVERFGFISAMRLREIYDAFGAIPDNLRRITYIPKEFTREDVNYFVKNEPFTLSAMQTSFTAGRSALLTIIQIYEQHPELPRLDYARALLHLADWHVKFEQRTKANQIYNTAFQVLAVNPQNGISSVNENVSLDSIVLGPHGFTSTINLAEKTDLELESLIKNDLKDTSFIMVQFNVSPAGIVNDFNILQSNPDNVRFRSIMKRQFHAVPFRPKFENGQPASAENVKMLYTLQNQIGESL